MSAVVALCAATFVMCPLLELADRQATLRPPFGRLTFPRQWIWTILEPAGSTSRLRDPLPITQAVLTLL